MLLEKINNPLKGISPYGWHFEQNVYHYKTSYIRAIKAGGGSGNIPKIIVLETRRNNLETKD